MTPNHLTHALVRPPGASFARAISSRAASIDVGLALAQHAEYCAALAESGLAVESIAADERYPDGCFMQDPAVVIAGIGVIGRLAAPARRGEEETIAAILTQRFDTARVNTPGTLEGGDVMVLPDRVLVGRSARSNAAGIAQLAVALATPSPYNAPGLPVHAIQVAGLLHLLTAATYLGHGILLAVEHYAEHPAFSGLSVLVVPPDESYAANALAVGDRVVLPAGFPGVAAQLRARGFTVLPVPLSEFAKADGGVTCLALAW